MLVSLLLICAALLYVQVIVIRGFNTEVVATDGYKIKLIPESRQTFGGLSWGLLRFDLEDRLDVGVSADVGTGRNLTMRLKKDGHTLVSTCRSDRSGTCYGLFRNDEMKMSGDFKLELQDGNIWKKAYQGKFVRQSRLVWILREFILSV
jgi:hypothetical protein